jgi:hypothetical protein
VVLLIGSGQIEKQNGDNNRGCQDVLAFNCVAYDFGIKEGANETVYLSERWSRWPD